MPICLSILLLFQAKDDLVRLADRLDALKKAQFAYQRHLNYLSNGYKHSLLVTVYVEFGQEWTPIRSRFLCGNRERVEGFNGKTYWCRIEKEPAQREMIPSLGISSLYPF
jgi:hypothetical protein